MTETNSTNTGRPATRVKRGYSDCPNCSKNPCVCPRNDDPAQLRIMAAVWLLRQAISSWQDCDHDDHDECCDCAWCVDLWHLGYMLEMQESAISGSMLGGRLSDKEGCTMAFSHVTNLAKFYGIIDDAPAASQASAPATVPVKQRKRWWFEFGCTTGDRA